MYIKAMDKMGGFKLNTSHVLKSTENLLKTAFREKKFISGLGEIGQRDIKTDYRQIDGHIQQVFLNRLVEI